MGKLVLLIGQSGSGKSTSFRNIPPEDSLWIKVINKPAPFRPKGWKVVDENGKGNVIQTDNAEVIKQIFKKAGDKGIKRILVDDANYILTNQFMRTASEKGYQKFSDMAENIWALFHSAQQDTADDIIVYMTWHTEETNMGDIKLKTIGKMLDEKVCLEGLATIVLRSDRIDGRYVFHTQTNGSDITKSPLGMFEEEVVDNDLNEIDKTIRKYYQGE